MPIRRIWVRDSFDRDIHLLRGDISRPLLANGVIWFADTSGHGFSAEQYLRDNGDVDLEFRPVMRFEHTGDEYHGFGISVDRQTGQITTVPLPPGPPPPPEQKIDNFVIEIVVLKNDGGPPVTDLGIPSVRVHLHNSVTYFWLTPPHLTVRRLYNIGPEETTFRFTARAEFDDGTVGDVTLHHGVTWAGPIGDANRYFFVDDPLLSDVANHFRRGQIRLPASVSDNSLTTITATLPAAWGGASAEADFTAVPPWSADPNPAMVTLFKPQPSKPAKEALNVLFVPTGYTAAELPQFDLLTTRMVHDIRTDPLGRPFNLLSGSINYWRAQLPTPERGVSVRAQVYFARDPVSSDRVEVVPAASRPGQGATELDVNDLLYLSGLPMPDDAPTKANLTNLDLRKRWAKTWPNASSLGASDPRPTGRGLDPLSEKLVPDPEILAWRKIATRGFVDEIDGSLPTCLGSPPSGDRSTRYAYMLNEDRGGALVFESFRDALQDVDGLTVDVPVAGTPVGELWADEPADGILFRNASTTILVFGITGGGWVNTLRGGPTHIDYALEDDFPVLKVLGRNRYELNLPPAPTVVSPVVARGTVHELAHCLGIGDEYLSEGGWPVFDGDDAGVTEPNLTTQAAASQGGQFDSKSIKWNWDRIEAARVLKAPLTAVGVNEYDATIDPSSSAALAVGDVVLLRAREWRVPITFMPRPTPSFEIKTINVNTLRLKYLGTVGAVDWNKFGAGSVLYRPVPAPVSARSPTNPYARMISPYVEQYIDQNHAPLSHWPSDPKQNWVDYMTDGVGMQYPTTVDFGGILSNWSHRDDSRIIGMYEGGNGYAGGLFHGAGMCRMRRGKRESTSFCAVCRYVIVDFIDPAKHGENDAQYDHEYPGDWW